MPSQSQAHSYRLGIRNGLNTPCFLLIKSFPKKDWSNVQTHRNNVNMALPEFIALALVCSKDLKVECCCSWLLKMSVFCTIKKRPYLYFTSEHNSHTRRQVTNQLKSGVGTSLTVEKRCTGIKEEVLFNIMKGKDFNFCCALRTQEEDSPVNSYEC